MKIKDIIEKIKNRLSALIKRIEPIKADVIVSIGVIFLSGLILAPSIYFCVVNHNKTITLEHMYQMMWALSDELSDEAETGETYFQDLIIDGEYKLLLSEMNERTGEQKKYPDKDFHMGMTGDQLEIVSNKYPELKASGVVLSAVENLASWNNAPNDGEGIVYITVNGPNTYIKNYVLDESRPEKMVYTGSELNRVLNNLTVTAVYEGGRRENLDHSRYLITSERVDMSEPGKKTLIVHSRSKSLWANSVYTTFALNVLDADETPPLVIDIGEDGKYELASWNWTNFVEETLQEKSGKIFGASIVRYNGDYYYYPDGMRIENNRKNTNPFEFALDTKEEKSAYSVKIDPQSVIMDSKDGDKVHNGSLRMENGSVYIWQDTPSKDLPKGWIRLYCDIRKY